MGASLQSGTRLGAHEVLRSLGRGGMGEVYRAKDLKLGREVALKVLLSEFASDSERLRRFEQEARAASALNHPNIVTIYDIDQQDDLHYIVMELVDGVTLREMLRDGAPVGIERVLGLGHQIASGLAKAHDAGIVHRDLKPENLMVTSDGFIKILDFGLAKLIERPFETHSEMVTVAREGTRHGTLLGTVEYMSPEQAAGKPVDYRSDQFSLGLILYEMTTGKLAFRRETAAQTLASIIESEPQPIADLNSLCPRALDVVISRCLAKVPEHRFADTRSLAKALSAVEPEGEPASSSPKTPAPVPQRVGVAQYVEHEVRNAFDEVEVELAAALRGRTRYQIDFHGRVNKLSESRLRKLLRRGRYSGVEMMRREGDDTWAPFYESKLFKDEVPHRGGPAQWASKRKVMGLARHCLLFVGVGIGLFFMMGEVPPWMAFWGIGLAAHALSTAPAAITLFKSRSLRALR